MLLIKFSAFLGGAHKIFPANRTYLLYFIENYFETISYSGIVQHNHWIYNCYLRLFALFKNLFWLLSGKDYILMGDLNCDLLTTTPHCYTKRLNFICESFNLTQIITETTRITETSETLLDVIYCSNASKFCKSGVIHAGISDHSVIYAIIGKNKNKADSMLNTDSTISNKQNQNYHALIECNVGSV